MADSREPGEAPEPPTEAQRDGEAGGEADPSESQLGPAPEVAGSDRIRDALRARLFGDGPDEAEDDSSDAPDEDRDRASRSGVIGQMQTLPGRSPRRTGPPTPGRVDRIGRFRVLDRLGAGGMGVVYSAYDPELDRKVAIKLLRPDIRQGMEARDEQHRRLGDESRARALRDAHARLLREAQAMARLSDPNVIVVHEVGTVDDSVFVAMEYIDGLTLGEWIADRSHAWREVLEVFLAAGSGLAAAHRAGLVHRDFKPDNVLLGKDGQVRVLDFGLARSASDETRPTPTVARPVRERPELDTLDTPLTRTGAVMGTPAYMSPEQYLGHAAGARSDQFSFCVALYEGLFGVRPFEGNSLAELADNVVEGRIRETPSDARVPGRLLAVLRRGLASDPDERFPSMEALLAQLRHDPGRKWRWGALVVGVGMATSLVTLAATGGDDVAEACGGIERELDGIWDDPARAEVRAAIEATGLDYAPRVATTTIELLDEYTQQWVSMAEDACGAALVMQGEDPEHRRRRQCLDQRLAEVEALVEALRESDSGMAEAAVKATTSLTTGLSACADPRRLAAYDVEDEATRERLAHAHAQLAKAKARGVLGSYDEAVALATEVVEQAREADAGALEALALLTRGTYRERTDDPKQSEQDLRAAIDLADRHGDPGTRAQALIMLIYVVALDRTRYVEARMLGDQARAVLDYIDADPLLLADLDNNLGVAARIEGDIDGALELHRRAHERRLEVLGANHPDIGRSLLNIGIALGSSPQHYAQAERYFRQALGSLERSLGPGHPTVGTALTNLGNCLARQQRYGEAMPLQQRALEIFEHAFGSDHVAVLRTVFNLGKIMQGNGEHEAALAMFQRGLAVREAEFGPDDVRLVGWVSHIGRSLLELRRMDEAAGYLERSLALRRAAGRSPLDLARDELRLARALADTDRTRARELAERAHRTLDEKVKADGGREETTESLLTWRDDAETWLAEHPASPRSE